MKIIIAVFLLVIVFYFLQFMLEFLKKKEHFSSSYFDDADDDREEHFVDAKPVDAKPVKQEAVVKQEAKPPQPSDSKPYELRIFILDEIEKLNITDKTVKGNVMEALFSETAMKELEGMSKDERAAKVKSIYESAKKAEAPAKQGYDNIPTSGSGTVKQETGKLIEEKIKSYFSNEVDMDEDAPKKERFDDNLQTKVKQASDKLDVVIDNLKEMKGILAGGTKEKYQPEMPVPQTIEGFENIRGYAYY